MRHVGLIVDIHGHSLKQGAFFYGCTPDKKHLRLRPSSPPLVPHTTSTRARSSRERARDGLCLVSPEEGGTPGLFSPTHCSDVRTNTDVLTGTDSEDTYTTHAAHPLSLSLALSLPFDNRENHYIPSHHKSLPNIPDFASKKDDEKKRKKSIDISYQDNYGECSTNSVDIITEDEAEKDRDNDKYWESEKEKDKEKDREKEKEKDREKDTFLHSNNETSVFEDRPSDIGHIAVPSPSSPQGMNINITPHGVQLPHKRSSLRDVLSWRVHLYPRICSALAPLFTVDSCRYRSRMMI